MTCLSLSDKFNTKQYQRNHQTSNTAQTTEKKNSNLNELTKFDLQRQDKLCVFWGKIVDYEPPYNNLTTHTHTHINKTKSKQNWGISRVGFSYGHMLYYISENKKTHLSSSTLKKNKNKK